MKTAAEQFKDIENVVAAIEQLQRSGYDVSTISVITPDPSASIEETGATRPDPNVVGAHLAGIGRIMADIALLPDPVVGSVVVAGLVATPMHQLAVDDLISTLIRVGIDEDQAQRYREGIAQGRALLLLRAADEQFETVREDLLRMKMNLEGDPTIEEDGPIKGNVSLNIEGYPSLEGDATILEGDTTIEEDGPFKPSKPKLQ